MRQYIKELVINLLFLYPVLSRDGPQPMPEAIGANSIPCEYCISWNFVAIEYNIAQELPCYTIGYCVIEVPAKQKTSECRCCRRYGDPMGNVQNIEVPVAVEVHSGSRMLSAGSF
uniref:Putative secreted protein n=1 Tax=Ixodes ricinus TaxID=34613 RepID=A0A6B0UKS8_IXORI